MARPTVNWRWPQGRARGQCGSAGADSQDRGVVGGFPQPEVEDHHVFQIRPDLEGVGEVERAEQPEPGRRRPDRREVGRDAGQNQPHRVQSGRNRLVGEAGTRPGRRGQQQLGRPAGAMSGVPLADRLRLRLLDDGLEEGGGVRLPGLLIRPPALAGAASPGPLQLRDE